jgi:hypothetical protein
MSRKKWTPQTEVDESLLQFREKRKWQIALRRYVLEKNKSYQYAPFFGLDIEKFREWIEFQFDEDLNWENFSKAWQFDHIVPVAYFDFHNEEDMFLCWNFTNLRVEKTLPEQNRGSRLDVLAAKSYFEVLLKETGYPLCQKMLEKIARIEASQIVSNTRMPQFLQDNKTYLEQISGFTAHEYEKVNTGTPLEEVLYELNFLKKFGN